MDLRLGTNPATGDAIAASGRAVSRPGRSIRAPEASLVKVLPDISGRSCTKGSIDFSGTPASDISGTSVVLPNGVNREVQVPSHRRQQEAQRRTGRVGHSRARGLGTRRRCRLGARPALVLQTPRKIEPMNQNGPVEGLVALREPRRTLVEVLRKTGGGLNA